MANPLIVAAAVVASIALMVNVSLHKIDEGQCWLTGRLFPIIFIYLQGMLASIIEEERC